MLVRKHQEKQMFFLKVLFYEKEKVRIGRRIVNDLSEFCSDENQESLNQSWSH